MFHCILLILLINIIDNLLLPFFHFHQVPDYLHFLFQKQTKIITKTYYWQQHAAALIRTSHTCTILTLDTCIDTGYYIHAQDSLHNFN